MSKKPTISIEAQVLLKLLRLVLGTEPRRYFGEPVEPFPTDINWKGVIRLSYEHKVSALAVDGLKSSGYDIYNGLNEQQTQELKAVAEPWFSSVSTTEQSYTYYTEVLNTLTQIYKANGLTPNILKGYGLSLNYPLPSHRGCGDIDIYLIDQDGNPAAAKGDEIASSLLGKDMNVPRAVHHSRFEFKGIKVENHYEWICGKGATEAEQRLKDVLTDMATNDAVKINGFHYPSPTANAIYLMWHTMRHLLREKVLYLQLCDWFTFVQKYHVQINWLLVERVWNDAGLKNFADATNTIMVKYLGMSPSCLPPFEMDEELHPIILNVGQCKRKTNGSGISNIAFYYRNRNIFKLTEGKSWLHLTINSTANHLKHKLITMFW